MILKVIFRIYPKKNKQLVALLVMNIALATCLATVESLRGVNAVRLSNVKRSKKFILRVA